MRIVQSFSILLLFCSWLFSSSSYFDMDHQVPKQAIIGEPLKLEISNLNNTQGIYDARIFYKTQGMVDYQSIEMQQKGYIFYHGKYSL